ncbi:hypothetical protein DXG01_004794 [Tephrocybe rancida]|nr:hypothetical protein DXG01_004794 [Tephrocybe rancida]
MTKLENMKPPALSQLQARASTRSSTSMPHIPSEVWLSIAKFIPQKTLRNLYSLNSLFLDLALNERYTDAASRKVDHLKRKYIGKLTTDLVAHFPNVTSFVLVTRYWPYPASLPLFLSNSWQAFSSNLRWLTINAPLAGFAALLPSQFDLVSLEDLTLRFSTDLTADDPSVDTQILSEVIVPFLQQVAPRLRTFNFMSSALGDHSALFQALDHMPCLTVLSLNIGFYPPLLSDPSGLTKLLRNNARNLRHVKLQPLQMFRSPPVQGYAHDYFTNWMKDNASDESLLSNLKTLVVLPSTDLVTMARFDASSLYIPRSKDTLINLMLGERCITFSELTKLVSGFEHRTPEHGLKVLHVKVISLNPQVFDLLAAKLEGLDDLDIKFNVLLDDVRYENPRPIEDEEATEQVRLLYDNKRFPCLMESPAIQAIVAFLNEMSNRVYPSWRLYSLWIWQRSFMTTKTAHEILTALIPSIPSVRVLYRMDHTHHLHTLFK